MRICVNLELNKLQRSIAAITGLMDNAILQVCPLVMSHHNDNLTYDGFITARGKSFQIHLQLGKANDLKGMKFDCEWRLKSLLVGYETVLQQRMNQCQNMSTFLVELKSILERVLKSEENETPWKSPESYGVIIQEIEQIGWKRLLYVDASFKTLHLTTADKQKRKHVLKLLLSPKHPDICPEATTDLPVPFTFSWTPKSTLEDLMKQFDRAVDSHQDLWDSLGEIDKNTWVLEPEKPVAFSSTFRRIALGSHASLHVEMNPLHPRHLPEFRFLGADHFINPIKENLNKNLSNWDSKSSLLKNLQQVLCVEFPSPATSSKEEFSLECGICYSYRLDGQLPDQVCDDPRCAQPFHHICLYEWLHTLSNTRQSFNLLFGECPYCGKAMTVKMPNS